MHATSRLAAVSVLFNEPKLLKSVVFALHPPEARGFSALQRAEIAEIQRRPVAVWFEAVRFSALQRAEIAEMKLFGARARLSVRVSVLFNEPKLLKSPPAAHPFPARR